MRRIEAILAFIELDGLQVTESLSWREFLGIDDAVIRITVTEEFIKLGFESKDHKIESSYRKDGSWAFEELDILMHPVTKDDR
jgi:hypothetical protein